MTQWKAEVARMRLHYQPGDPVVFVVSKTSTDPGPRAHDITPAPFGETYQYVVDKYWTVRCVRADGTVELVTRRGKVRHAQPNDPRLRPARWWERWVYRDRFPALNRAEEARNGPQAESRTDLETAGR